MGFIGRQDVDRIGAVIYGGDVRARVLDDGDKLREDWEEVEYVRADLHRGAVALLDDLADVLARVTGPEPPERTEIDAVLLRAARHANGGQ